MIKLYKFLLIIALSLSLGSSALAQTSPENLPENLPEDGSPVVIETITEGNVKIGNVYIVSNVLNKTEYAPGETISGELELYNDIGSDVTDLKYKINISDPNHVTGIEQMIDTSALFGPVSIKQGETIKVSYSYTIPNYAPGGTFNMRVETERGGGQRLSFFDSEIKITGSGSLFGYTDAYVFANGKEYGIQEGPTIATSSPDNKFIYKILNPGAETSVTEMVTVTRWGNFQIDPVVLEKAGVALTKGESTHEITIPVMKDPGVYEAKLELKNSSGEIVSTKMNFRFIQGGDIATIFSVTADNTSVKSGEKLTVKIDWAGSPLNIDDILETNFYSATAIITIKDQNGETVGYYDGPIKDNHDEIAIQASKDGENLKATVEIYKADKKIVSYESDLGFYSEDQVVPAGDGKAKLAPYYYTILAALILAGLIIFFKNRNKKVAATFIIAGALLISTGIVYGYVETYRAGTTVYAKDPVTKQWRNWQVDAFNISLSSPIEGGWYQKTNTNVNFAISFSYYGCDNSTNSSAHLWYQLDAEPNTALAANKDWLPAAGTTHLAELYNKSYSAVAFNANNLSVGSHKMYFVIKTVTNAGGVKRVAWVKGYQEFNIYVPTNGQCAATHNNCSAGSSVDVTDSGTQFLWSCNGVGGGTNANCSENKVNGQCAATHNNCTVGTSVDVADSGSQYLWTCVSPNGATNANCAENKPATNGQCGSTNNSCSAGTLSDTADSGTQYLWSCNGTNGGTNANCALNKPVTPVCGSINGTSVCEADFPSLWANGGSICNPGSKSATYTFIGGDDARWTWQCLGSGSSIVSCYANKSNSPLCGGVSDGTGPKMSLWIDPNLVDDGEHCTANWEETVQNEDDDAPTSCTIKDSSNNVEHTVPSAELQSGSWSNLQPGDSYKLSCIDAYGDAAETVLKECIKNPFGREI